MKVTLETDYKRFYTICELEQAKAVIKAEKEDEETPSGWAEYAVREALKDQDDDYLIEVIKAEAHTVRNNRVWNAYGFDENTGFFDVWIDAIARTRNGFVVVGACLSDIWQTGAVEYKNHMLIHHYRLVEN